MAQLIFKLLKTNLPIDLAVDMSDIRSDGDGESSMNAEIVNKKTYIYRVNKILNIHIHEGTNFAYFISMEHDIFDTHADMNGSMSNLMTI